MVPEIVKSPVNIILATIVTLFFYRYMRRRQKENNEKSDEDLPMLRKDFSVEELRKYDGSGPDRRILVAVSGKVFDVTAARNLYGKGQQYGVLAGRDASRSLATFSLTCPKDGYDDLSDLNSMELEALREWEMQFRERYIYVGRLLRPGETPVDYSQKSEELYMKKV